MQVTTTPAVTTAEVTTTVATTMPTTSAPVASMILIAGGHGPNGRSTLAEVLTGGLNQTQLPNLPTGTTGQSMINHYGTIVHCGGDNTLQSCLELSNGSWVSHSMLNAERYFSGAASTNSGSFIFGGDNSDNTKRSFEYMTRWNTNWQTGNTNIPNGYDRGCVIQISGDLLYLIGGRSSANSYENRILAFNTTSHVFTTLSTTLITGRYGHSCEFIPNTNKVMISGGYDGEFMDVTEVLDVTTGSISNGPAMNIKRSHHGSGIITVSGQDRLIVLGGWDGSSFWDSIELFNPNTNSWELMNESLTTPRFLFGYLTIKEGDI